jgi:hypothetical protein
MAAAPKGVCEHDAATGNRAGCKTMDHLLALALHLLLFVFKGRVSVTGSIRKDVRCERCELCFTYEMTRSVSEVASNIRDPVETHAALGLRIALEDECDMFPCPTCGWYQRHMVEFARRRATRNVRWWLLGGFVWVVCFFLAATDRFPSLFRGCFLRSALWG